MHFHLPKPLHGWRAFVGEVGIIVLGVLIALSAEQVVQAISWKKRANDTIDTVRGELGSSYVHASELVIAQPCIDLQLQMLEQRLSKAGGYQPAPLYTEGTLQFAYRVPLRNWLDDAWQSALVEGDASHLDPKLRLSLAATYSQIGSMRADGNEVAQLYSQLRVLTQPIHPDDATRARLIEELEHARGVYGAMALGGNQIVRRIDDVDLNPDAAEVARRLGDSGTLKFCRAHHLPLGKVEPRKS